MQSGALRRDLEFPGSYERTTSDTGYAEPPTGIPCMFSRRCSLGPSLIVQSVASAGGGGGNGGHGTRAHRHAR